MGKQKSNIQTSLFSRDSNFVSREDFLKDARKPTQHEKKFMKDIMEAAFKLGLPCIHIDYYCGNKFYATCEPCQKKSKGARRVLALCSECHKPVLAECHNRLNKNLAGHFDILGIGWAIETKHKINKGKQTAKESRRQEFKKVFYDALGIPNLTINESDNQETVNFLMKLREQLILHKPICKKCGQEMTCRRCSEGDET